METAGINTTLLKEATVADAMGPVHLVMASLPIAQAAVRFQTNRGRALVVDTGDDSPSIFTEFDIVKVIAAGESIDGKTVGDHHTRTAVAAKPSWSLDRALHTMMAGQFRHLVVIDGGEVVGMLAMRDILGVIVDEDELPVELEQTVEFAATVPESTSHLLHNLRRGAKQHYAAIKCDCELDWIDVVIGQAEERPDLTAVELQSIWEQRPLCPTLNNPMGGGGD